MSFWESVGAEVFGGALVAIIVLAYERYRDHLAATARRNEAQGLIRSELRRHMEISRALIEAEGEHIFGVGRYETPFLRVLPIWGGFDANPESDRIVAVSAHVSMAEHANALRHRLELMTFSKSGHDALYEDELSEISQLTDKLKAGARDITSSAQALIGQFI